MVGELMSDYGSRLFIAVFGVGLGLLCLVGVLLILRRRTGPAPFLRGGKNRQPRLQVLDAAAVDARRRIVLVRRDNVEHLVMIGGPTDIVIESGIHGASHIATLQAPSAEPDVLSLQAPPTEPRLQAPARQQQLAAPQPEHAAPPALLVETARPDPVRSEPVRPEPVRPEPTRHEPVRQEPARAEQALLTPEPRHPTPARRTTVEAQIPVEPPQRSALSASPASAPRVETPMPAVEEAPLVSLSAARQPAVDGAAPAPRVAEATPSADIGAAADALDAARRRVFQPALDRTPPATPASGAATAPADEPDEQDATAAPEPKTRSLGSDFDRILEEEMANNLAAEPAPMAPSAATAPTPSMPRRDPASPRVTGATPEPSLQNEIARIFGEMSVTRDQR